jgi:hypothetical protein
VGTGVLVLVLVLLALLLAVFVYRIVTTPVPAVDAPTVMNSAAALPDVPRHALPVPAAAWPAPETAPPGASPRRRSSSAPLVIGVAALIIGGWLILRIVPTGTACSHLIEVCSQGLVVLTGAQLAGVAIAVAGLILIAIAGARAVR